MKPKLRENYFGRCNLSNKKTIWDEGKRLKLKKVLPLDTPLSLNIEAAGVCNITCVCCNHAMPESKKKQLSFSEKILDEQSYYKLIDDCTGFNEKIKTIRFAGYGEPTLNKKLPNMIEYAKLKNVVDEITIFTNALALCDDLTKNIVTSGVDIFRVNIMGLSTEDYKKMLMLILNLKN
jgi:cyclic pyranopterin phosphate synthase